MKKPPSAKKRPSRPKPVARKPRRNLEGAPGTFRFGRDPIGIFHHRDTLIHGDLHAYVDLFDTKGKPVGGGIAITHLLPRRVARGIPATSLPPPRAERGVAWVFVAPDGNDAPYLDGQAHTARGTVYPIIRWAKADHSALIVGKPSAE